MRVIECVHLTSLPTMDIEAESNLRNVILRVATSLRFRVRAVWRRCDSTWRRRIRSMSFSCLCRELRFLLGHAGFHRKAQFHARIFRDVPSAIEIGGEFIREIAMQHVSVLQDLWIAYQEQQGN